jgi:hypothetical protein
MEGQYSQRMALANSYNSTRLRRTGPWHCGLNAAIVAALLFSGSIELLAQTNVTIAPTHVSNRFLFIVETSRNMRPRAQGVFDAMKQALDSSLNGQIHQGDLVGIWTFNENVNQGLFPSQEWSQSTQLAFAVRLTTLADSEIYLKNARLEKVIPEMLKVISESENLTIIFVSSGDGVMQGTPFSAPINSAWKEWHDELEGVHMPLQTVMRTRNGQPYDWLITPAPRPISLPSLAAKPDDDAVSNPRGVVLESGPVRKKPESTTLAPEQQVAFSIWALGKTSLINPATNQPTTSSKLENPAQPPPATPSVSGTDKDRTPDKQVSTATSKNPPADLGKSADLSTATNAHSTVFEPPVEESKPVETPTSTELAATTTQPNEVTSSQQILAHARAANPEQDKRGLDRETTAPPVAPRGSFLRDNINSLVLMIVAGLGAAYCFKRWFSSQARATRTTVSLAQDSVEESRVEGKKGSIRSRAAA